MKCLNCNKELKNRQKKYCSTSCQVKYQGKEKIRKWFNDEWDGTTGKKIIELSDIIRHYLIPRANGKCEECGWNEINSYTLKTTLEIHHIDGNYLNNRPNNLKVLCPNCHSLTSTYKGRGNGRVYRNK